MHCADFEIGGTCPVFVEPVSSSISESNSDLVATIQLICAFLVVRKNLSAEHVLATCRNVMDIVSTNIMPLPTLDESLCVYYYAALEAAASARWVDYEVCD
jgi:hypothetical protein